MTTELQPSPAPGKKRFDTLNRDRQPGPFSEVMHGVETLLGEMDPFVQEATMHPFELPRKFLARAGELGLLALNIPIAEGGKGLTTTQIGEVMTRFAYEYPGFALTLFSIGCSVTSEPIIRSLASADITLAQREERLTILKELREGRDFAAFALTEPLHGSDAGRSLDTLGTLTPDGQALTINGTKSFISNGGAKYIIATVLTPEGLKSILVDTQHPQEFGGSVKVVGYSEKSGQLGAVLTTINFDNFTVPVSSILGDWEKIVKPTLAVGRNIIAAQAMGMAMKAFDVAYTWAHYRLQFDQLLVNRPLIANSLRLALEQIIVCKTLLERATHATEAGDVNASILAYLAKMVIADYALKIAIFSQQITGARGYTKGFHLLEGMNDPFENEPKLGQIAEQLVRDAQGPPIYEGSRSLLMGLLSRYFDMKKIKEMFYPDLLLDLYGPRRRGRKNLRPTLEEKLEFVRTVQPKPSSVKETGDGNAAVAELENLAERYIGNLI